MLTIDKIKAVRQPESQSLSWDELWMILREAGAGKSAAVNAVILAYQAGFLRGTGYAKFTNKT